MLLKDMAKVYIASKNTQIDGYGQPETSYTDLRSVSANLQYMSNEEEQKTFGKITNSIVVIRMPNPIKAEKGDGIYLFKPEEINSSYGEPDYNIESIKTAYTGVISVRNPIVITARINNDAKHKNQTQGQP